LLRRSRLMETTMQGTIRGKSIELDSDIGLPTGSRVTLRIERAPTLSTEGRLQRLLKLFRELGRDEGFVKALAEIEKHRSGPREVNLVDGRACAW
jgi:hypothetical protein